MPFFNKIFLGAFIQVEEILWPWDQPDSRGDAFEIIKFEIHFSMRSSNYKQSLMMEKVEEIVFYVSEQDDELQRSRSSHFKSLLVEINHIETTQPSPQILVLLLENRYIWGAHCIENL